MPKVFFSFGSDPWYNKLVNASESSTQCFKKCLYKFAGTGGYCGPVSMLDVNKLILERIAGPVKCNDTDLKIYLHWWFDLLDEDERHGYMCSVNWALCGFWRPAHSHPLWFHFAIHLLDMCKAPEYHRYHWSEQSLKRIMPELANFFKVFPTYSTVYHLLAWELLRNLSYSDDELSKMIHEAVDSRNERFIWFWANAHTTYEEAAGYMVPLGVPNSSPYDRNRNTFHLSPFTPRNSVLI